MWISSVFMSSIQCGWMNSRTASIGEENCNNLLPFVCEKGIFLTKIKVYILLFTFFLGTKSYQEPIMWRKDVILAVILLTILIILMMCLALCACRKSQSRKENFLMRKEFVRNSLRRSQHLQQKQQKNGSAVELVPNMVKSSYGPPTTFFWPNNVAGNPPPLFSSTCRSSSSLTTNSTSGFSPSTASSTTRNITRGKKSGSIPSHNDILRTDKYNSKNIKSPASLQNDLNNKFSNNIDGTKASLM